MTEKLLPCPFCGREAEIISRPVYTYLKPYDPETADKKHYVQCKGCATQCGALEYDTPEEAIAAWNRRSRPENKPLTLDELRQMDGEPVWISYEGEINLVELFGERRGYIWFWYFGNEAEEGLLTEHYGKAWFAYRRKPERSEG